MGRNELFRTSMYIRLSCAICRRSIYCRSHETQGPEDISSDIAFPFIFASMTSIVGIYPPQIHIHIPIPVPSPVTATGQTEELNKGNQWYQCPKMRRENLRAPVVRRWTKARLEKRENETPLAAKWRPEQAGPRSCKK